MKQNSDRSNQLTRAFQEHFGAQPTIWCRAPGRVDLMGSHTDYNLGYVLTLPIGLDTWMAVRPREDRTVRLYSLNLADETSFSLDLVVPDTQARWSNYVRGVAAALQAGRFVLRGFDGVIHTTVPMGGGLSSSAALECATATVFEALGGWRLDPVEKARLCQRAENQFVGVNCGILDQYTSCAGRAGCALLLDCRHLSHRAIRLPEDMQVVVCDTKSKRELATSEYGLRRAQCEEGARRLGVKALRDLSVQDFSSRERELSVEVAKRCRFIVEENNRVLGLAAALQIDDRRAVSQLTADSFLGACDLYAIGAPAMHAMMRAMRAAPGVIGARQAGAGFGGCLVAFVEKDRIEVFAKSVRESYLAETKTKPDVFAVAAADGAGLLLAQIPCSSVGAYHPTPPRHASHP